MLEFQTKIQEQLAEIGIVPVVKLTDENKAADLAKALISGGIKAAEITFRAKGAEKVIAAMTRDFPEILVGAGTVLTLDQVKAAVGGGARFIVSPGFDEDVVDFCLANRIPVFPGCVTPSEIQKAIKKGLKVIKFFPAAQFGGLDAIKALSGPFPGIKFMPTGGISETNLEEYLKNDLILACGGSFMVKESYIDKGDWQTITEKSAEAVRIKDKARRKK